MIHNTSTQSQDLFNDCLGFARQLSQSPGVYCRLEVKLGENSFIFQTGSPGKFPGKRKSPSDYRRDQRRKKPPGKGMPTPGNQGISSVAPVDPARAQKGLISQAFNSANSLLFLPEIENNLDPGIIIVYGPFFKRLSSLHDDSNTLLSNFSLKPQQPYQ